MRVSQPTVPCGFLSKQATSALKGIAIMLMLFHHLFTFPTYWVGGTTIPLLENVAQYLCWPTKLCVGLFAFLTGWGYAFTKRKTIAYSLKKILHVYTRYWVVFAALLAVCLISGCFEPKWQDVLLEIAALRRPIMYFAWYVPFYAIAMLLLPLLTRVKNFIADVIFVLILPLVGSFVLMKGFERLSLPICAELCSYLFSYFPCVALGYLMAKWRLISDWVLPLAKKYHLYHWPIRFLMILLPFVGRYFLPDIMGVNLDLVYVPVFILGATEFIRNFKLLHFFGNYSLSIWFLHCAFFGATASALQKFAYFPYYEPLVFLWVLFSLSAISYVIEKLFSICKVKI